MMVGGGDYKSVERIEEDERDNGVMGSQDNDFVGQRVKRVDVETALFAARDQILRVDRERNLQRDALVVAVRGVFVLQLAVERVENVDDPVDCRTPQENAVV